MLRPSGWDGRTSVFLLSAKVLDLWDEAWSAAATRQPGTESSAARHVVCALRLLLLLPVAACVVVAWLAAAGLTLTWRVLATPFRRGGGTTLD
jgi:hypothetical protein